MELYKGLPLKTITAQDKQGVEHIFGVTTGLVHELITLYLDTPLPYLGEVEEFDNSYSYAVPQYIFEMEDDDIVNYINQNIDDNFKI